jgi:hypothetical protein
MARPSGARSGACSRTDRYSGRNTTTGVPAAACTVARPRTASANPPVRAYGAYSAARCTTVGRAPPVMTAPPLSMRQAVGGSSGRLSPRMAGA